jgi:hypothetical protein
MRRSATTGLGTAITVRDTEQSFTIAAPKVSAAYFTGSGHKEQTVYVKYFF